MSEFLEQFQQDLEFDADRFRRGMQEYIRNARNMQDTQSTDSAIPLSEDFLYWGFHDIKDQARYDENVDIADRFSRVLSQYNASQLPQVAQIDLRRTNDSMPNPFSA